MATASVHARRRHHPATEAGLWLVWITARITGLARLACKTRRLVRVAVDSDAAHQLDAACRDLWDTAGRAAHRVLIRAELAADQFLTGPGPELVDAATARLKRRAGWLLLAGGFLLNLLYLAVR